MNSGASLTNTVRYVDVKQPEPLATSNSMKPNILWIDGVGGYLMLDRDDLLIGQAGGVVDIGIVGDISRQAGLIHRRESDYFLEPLQDSQVNGAHVSEIQLLPSPVELQFGTRVKLRFIKPHPLSSSARLELVSLHRFQPRVDGVLLLADSCILGPSSSCHVRCPEWDRDLLMFRQSHQWFFRPSEPIEVDGRSQMEPFALSSGMRVRGPDFSLSIE